MGMPCNLLAESSLIQTGRRALCSTKGSCTFHSQAEGSGFGLAATACGGRNVRMAVHRRHCELLCGGRGRETFSDRPELAKALYAALKAKATLLIAKLDRLARNPALIANSMDVGAEFLACDQVSHSRHDSRYTF